MTKFFSIVSICICAFVTVQTAAVSPQDCEHTFQSQLKELLATRQKCGSGSINDCCQIKQLVLDIPTGVYGVTFAEKSPSRFPVTYTRLSARCDMDTDGGGWMVIQRRVPGGTLNFTRGWSDYVRGFGDLEGEFWYGLDNIHYLTTRDNVELRIDMVMEDDGSKMSFTYQTFTVAGPEDEYRLTIGGGEGNGDDAMPYHNGQQFSTIDNDNDPWGSNCAYVHQGGWWYNACYCANLNGPHVIPPNPDTHAGLIWYDGGYRAVSTSEMKVRVKDCSC